MIADPRLWQIHKIIQFKLHLEIHPGFIVVIIGAWFLDRENPKHREGYYFSLTIVPSILVITPQLKMKLYRCIFVVSYVIKLLYSKSDLQEPCRYYHKVNINQQFKSSSGMDTFLTIIFLFASRFSIFNLSTRSSRSRSRRWQCARWSHNRHGGIFIVLDYWFC